jgi:hypothetical protein
VYPIVQDWNASGDALPSLAACSSNAIFFTFSSVREWLMFSQMIWIAEILIEQIPSSVSRLTTCWLTAPIVPAIFFWLASSTTILFPLFFFNCSNIPPAPFLICNFYDSICICNHDVIGNVFSAAGLADGLGATHVPDLLIGDGGFVL